MLEIQSVGAGQRMMLGRFVSRAAQLHRRSLFNLRFRSSHCGVSAFLTRNNEENVPYLVRKPFQLHHLENIWTGRVSFEQEVPVKSPLADVPVSEGEDLTQADRAKVKPKIVKAMLREIPQSPKKMNLVAKVVRGMRVNDALIQMSVLVKRAAETVYKVLHSARANAIHNYGYDPEKLIVAEAFVGKGTYLKRIWPHAKGRFGIRERKRCRLTVYLREMTEKEEKLLEVLRKKQKEGRYIYRTKLLPHRLMETRWCQPRKVRRGYPGQYSTPQQAEVTS